MAQSAGREFGKSERQRIRDGREKEQTYQIYFTENPDPDRFGDRVSDGVLFLRSFASDTFTNLRNNSFEMFNGKVINVSDSLTNNMIRVWSNISETENDVVSRVETILQEQGKSYEDIAKPFTEEEKATEGPRTYHINEIILSEIADDILYMLRKNLVTDAFIVLDGPGTRNQPQDYYKGGICLRDMDPTSASSDNADIEMTYGSIEIRDQLHVTGNKTYSTFEFSEECSNDNEAFFFKPLNAAKEAKKVSDTKNYAYWSPSYKMNQYGETIVSYSIPLISSKRRRVRSAGHRPFRRLSERASQYRKHVGRIRRRGMPREKTTRTAAWIWNASYIRAVLGQSVFGSVSSVSALPDGYTNFYKIPSSKVVCNVKTLDIYNRNGPFSGDVWAVVGMVDEGVLMTFYNTILIAMSASALAAGGARARGGHARRAQYQQAHCGTCGGYAELQRGERAAFAPRRISRK